MKKHSLLIVFLSALFFISCKKDDVDPIGVPTILSIRYEFTADTLGTYDISYAVDTVIVTEAVAAQSWSKTVTFAKPASSTGDSAVLQVVPPLAWIGTSSSANATIKIFINDVEKGSNAGRIGGFDRPDPLRAIAPF